MEHALVFVLAPQEALPGDSVDWEGLLAAQRQGVAKGTALRMYRVPADVEQSLDDLVGSGEANASGTDPFLPALTAPASGIFTPRRLICDALIPGFETKSLWLGAYELHGTPWAEPIPQQGPPMAIDRISCLDHVAMAEIDHETCWFYPTDNGDYLCWENSRSLELLPGYPVEASRGINPIVYDRGDLRLLWSLMADDQNLTCVGLTYQRHRIEWPIAFSDAALSATWTAFTVDDMADEIYREQANITVFSQGKP
ncbi:hypothetical protein [Cyanobium sp. Morenito 9A2]|uniref:hypothetical protein n=1 Tax=Cyanobium sp. Morenito 9A2 TaxID=2823718 RepID=UPI0020CD9E56|nr:hypothetical protein [Cyanobium sp. Morenito 9A2]MCP9850441.1 hypothetical protein [Cyanobium sp. Morenito 9A2]